MLTERELRYCDEIAARLARAREFLLASSIEAPPDPIALFALLSSLRQIQGNLSNDVSFAATLLAKSYLITKFGINFDAAEKPQGASGIDIVVITSDGEQVVGEIKTTVPYQVNDLGAKQAEAFRKDFAKLAKAEAKHKFLFVTSERTYTVLLKPKYLAHLRGVTVVNLTTGTEHAA